MNSEDRFELAQIRRDQTRIRELVDQLDHRIGLLAGRLDFLEAAPAPLPPGFVSRVAVPPPLPPAGSHHEAPPAAEPALPAPIPEAFTPKDTPAAPAAPADAAKPEEPLELRVGTYWMARLGILILLTGLVFLGNYAYHRIVPVLGAWGKLSLLALAGVALGGLGAWLMRSREATRSYGRVLLAGGAATIYYTTYAAHFVEKLRVIESPLFGGGLLLALTGAAVFYADRHRSEAIAVPALLLAFYTSSINAIGPFTLFSNLLLTAIAVFFLVRHQWARLTFLGLAATYGSFTFWRVNHALAAGGSAEMSLGLTFLGLYWALFTAAAFLAAPAALKGPQRISFLTLNNGALFALAAWYFTGLAAASFWIFTLGFGGVLLGLSALAVYWRSAERSLDGTYLAQGIALVTIGLAAKLTGPQLAVVLAVESAGLLIAMRDRHRWLYQLAAALCTIAAGGLTLDSLDRPTTAPLALALPVCALLAFDSWWLKRSRGMSVPFCGRAFGFALLSLATFAALLWHVVPQPWQPTAFALVAVLSLGALRVRWPEMAWPGQAFLLGGLLLFVARYAGLRPEPWWIGAPLIVLSIALMHWWQRQKSTIVAAQIRAAMELICATVAVAAGLVWMRDYYTGERWLWATSAGALACLLYGLATRGWAMALAGQAFTGCAAVSFASALIYEDVGRWAAATPVLAVALTGWLVGYGAGERTIGGARVHELVRFYRLCALAMLGAWAFVYVEPAWRVIFYAGCGAGMILLGALTANPERRKSGAIYTALALAFFCFRSGWTVTWQELLAIAAGPASLRLGQRLCGETPLLPAGREVLVGAAMTSLWLWVTRWALGHGYGDQLTIAWALLALAFFAGGLALRERLYRLGGFAVLALAVGRLFIIDVWRFDTLPRIVSFLVLGVVLLGLSFIYHRFAEALKRWL